MGMDLDLRKLRYFAAVAEHRHFGRAAEQLCIAQPVLSRQIRALESELGCALFERTTRAVQLTSAGEQLLEDVPGVLAASAAATRRVHRAARGTRRLVIGFAPGLSVAGAVRAFQQENPGIGVDMQRLNWFEQAEALRDGRVDVGYLRRPFDGHGIRCLPVGSEPVVACLPAAHPLSSKPYLVAADLSAETVLDTEIRRATTVEEKFELVAAGRGIAVLPRSVAEYYSQPGLVYLPIADTAPYELCIAVIKNRRQQHLREFVKVAVAALADSTTAGTPATGPDPTGARPRAAGDRRRSAAPAGRSSPTPARR
jgi:DNA-binding transcriptional LysR family regulator